MKKRILTVVVMICMMLSCSAYAISLDDWLRYRETPSNITVQFNGEEIDFTDEAGNIVEPQIINDRTMVPMRKIFEEFGAKVEWNASDRSIRASKNGLEIWLQIDNTTAKVTKDGKTEQIKLDTAPTIVDNRTLVPVRFIAESLDLKVGWESWSRTVIIMDLSFVEKEIKEKASNLYAYLTDDYETLTAYDVGISLDADISVKDTKKNTSETGRVKADGNFILVPDALKIEGKVDVTGKGESFESIKKDLPEKMEGSFILDFKNAIAYLKSPLLKEEGIEIASYQWLKYQLEDDEKEALQAYMSEFADQLVNGPLSISDSLDKMLTEEYLDTDTYEAIRQITNAITAFGKDEYFQVKNTKNGKTYSYHITKDDLVNIIKELLDDEYDMDSLKKEFEGIEFDLSIDITVEDKIATKSTIKLNISKKERNSLIEGKVAVSAGIEAYNDDVKLTIPAGKNVIDVYEYLYGEEKKNTQNNGLNTAGQAQFSGFRTEMGALQDSFKQAQITIRGLEIGRGHDVTEAQIYNYLARGGNESGEITQDASGDEKWLTRAQAKSIPCTPINRAYATFNLDMRVRKVETDQASNEIVSYFITPKGNVFCWPPYPHDGRSYVTNEITAKTKDGKEYAYTDATARDAEPVITFPNGEVIYISNNPSKKLNPSNVSTENDVFDANAISVIYDARQINANTGGTSYGFTFDNYNNNH